MTTPHAKSNAREGDGVAAVADEMKFLAMAFPRADLQHGGAAIATLCTEIDKWADRLTDAMQAQQGAEPVAAEMKQLLHSTHEIALRGGADTNWEGLAKSIAKLGIAPITARHYFAEGTPREAISKHLDALLAHVNAPATGAPR